MSSYTVGYMMAAVINFVIFALMFHISPLELAREKVLILMIAVNLLVFATLVSFHHLESHNEKEDSLHPKSRGKRDSKVGTDAESVIFDGFLPQK